MQSAMCDVLTDHALDMRVCAERCHISLHASVTLLSNSLGFHVNALWVRRTPQWCIKHTRLQSTNNAYVLMYPKA